MQFSYFFIFVKSMEEYKQNPKFIKQITGQRQDVSSICRETDTSGFLQNCIFMESWSVWVYKQVQSTKK